MDMKYLYTVYSFTKHCPCTVVRWRFLLFVLMILYHRVAVVHSGAIKYEFSSVSKKS